MVGQPIFMQLCATIEERGGEDWFFEELAVTGSVVKLARQMNISRDMLYRWRNRSDERRKRWDEALREGASIALDEADELMEDMPLRGNMPADVTARNSKANWMKERAKMLDPERFDKQAAAAGSIGNLLLSALQARGTVAAIAKDEPLQLMEAEIIEGV
jgi:transposase-like protein